MLISSLAMSVKQLFLQLKNRLKSNKLPATAVTAPSNILLKDAPIMITNFQVPSPKMSAMFKKADTINIKLYA
jgi:hypothetical protein